MEAPRLVGIMFAAAALALVPAGEALAQSADDIRGTYPLTITTSGNDCPEGSSATLEVKTVGESTIGLVLAGPETTLAYDPAAHTFSGSFSEQGFTATVSGNFVSDGERVFVNMTIDYPGDCRAIFTGSHPAGGEAGGAPGTGGSPGAGGDGGEDDGLDPLLPLLIIILVALAFLGARWYMNQAKKGKFDYPPAEVYESPPEGQPDPGAGGAAGLAGKAAAAALTKNPSVGADRFGGFGDRLSYGDDAGSAVPKDSGAYESLVRSVSPQAALGSRLLGGEPVAPESLPNAAEVSIFTYLSPEEVEALTSKEGRRRRYELEEEQRRKQAMEEARRLAKEAKEALDRPKPPAAGAGEGPPT